MKKKQFLRRGLLVFLLFGITANINAQNSEDGAEPSEKSKKEIRKSRPTYIRTGVGIGYGQFRDFATSPLFYDGLVNRTNIGYLRKDNFRELDYGFIFDSGNSFTTTYRNDYLSNDSYKEASFSRLDLHFGQLFGVDRLSILGLNTKIGYKLSASGNLRINQSLSNNGIGAEGFVNLSGALKLTKDFSREKTVQKKLLFIPYKLKAKKRDVSAQFNIGVVNGNFRNGFAYQNNAPSTNKWNIEDLLFSGHEFHVFDGYRFNFDPAYTRYLKNNNAIKFAYRWEALSTGDNFGKLQQSQHSLEVSMHFNTK